MLMRLLVYNIPAAEGAMRFLFSVREIQKAGFIKPLEKCNRESVFNLELTTENMFTAGKFTLLL